MAGITLEITGMTGVLGKLDKYNKTVQAEVKDEVNASALKIQSDAKKAAPVNLGTLRNTIYLAEQSVSNLKYVYSVGAQASYAPYIEFGTGGKVSIPTGYESYANGFKGKSKGKFKDMLMALTEWVQKKGIASGKQSKSVAYMIAISILRKGLRPQPFLIPAFEREKPKLKLRIEKILKNAKS
jgi:HK97 gp10 family phage protein